MSAGILHILDKVEIGRSFGAVAFDGPFNVADANAENEREDDAEDESLHQAQHCIHTWKSRNK